MKKLFEKIGQFFKSLFNGAQRTWDKLSPEVKAALEHGSGIVAIVNKNIDAIPDVILAEIQKKYPDLSIDKLKEGLDAVSSALNLVIDPDIIVTIQNIQKYLGERKGRVWALASDTVAKVVSVFLHPAFLFFPLSRQLS